MADNDIPFGEDIEWVQVVPTKIWLGGVEPPIFRFSGWHTRQPNWSASRPGGGRVQMTGRRCGDRAARKRPSNRVINFRHDQPRTLVDNGGHYARGQARDSPGSLTR